MYLEQHPDVPFETLVYLIAVINYGGRVTDNKDERLILAILLKYFNKDVMGTKLKFSTDGKYYSPEELELPQIKQFIKKLPLDDDPEIFGMHTNALITL